MKVGNKNSNEDRELPLRGEQLAKDVSLSIK
jgi:hypothetical protein